MPFTVFVPHDVAERCYLSEALSWVALNRFPLAVTTDNGCDVREDDDFIFGLVPRLSEEDTLSDEECARVGLPPNPMYKHFDSGDVPPDPNYFKIRLQKTTNEITRNTYLKQLFDAEFFIAKREDWEAEFNKFLDLYKSRLFLALRENKISALGQKLPHRSFVQSAKILEESDWFAWNSVEWEQIPSEFWISTNIDWSECWAEGKEAAYCLIMMKFEDLFELFPPSSEVVEGVTKVGNAIMQGTAIATTPIQKSKRGRPSHSWDEFHLEVARRLLQGNVPSKKEAFIQEMQDWCRAKWLFPVGRSTISQKLKPYYDQLIRNPKSSNN